MNDDDRADRTRTGRRRLLLAAVRLVVAITAIIALIDSVRPR